ncbi:MAG: 1-phosphofructokinase [Chloroflexi bacterium]|nr:1-phosphofructokinase [Chloroflexota bacterium]
MIITLTPNPAVDHTSIVDCLKVGTVNRFQYSYLDPAGKGINVSRMVHRLGWPTIAFGFLAGELGVIVEKALTDEGVDYHFVRIPGQTRLNTTIVERTSGTATSLHGPGPAVDGEHIARLENLLRFWLQAGRVLVLAGSLPPGVPTDIYATYLHLAHAKGVKTILDADGEPLRRGVAARPYLIKPNVAEAERLLGRALPDLPAVVDGARELARCFGAIVVISMGAQGAVCIQGEKGWHAVPPAVERHSTVGSGDAMVAGLAVALARGDNIVEGLQMGTAAGAATAMTPGTALGTVEDVAALLPRVEIAELR